MDFEDKTSVLNLTALAKPEAVEGRSACFIVLTGSQAGRMYKLERPEMVIGRAQDAIIRIDDDGVSRTHAKISRLSDGNIVLADLGSTNGTFCNGQRVSERRLQDGDKIQIGTTTILKFSYQDVVEEDFQRRQYESATRDALTQTFNKKYFLERLPSELAFAVRHSKALALAMFDIDRFKKINDTYGHPAGDHVLRELSRVVNGQIRQDDVLARYGGEEFALIMRETLAEAAFIVAERIRRKVEATQFMFEGQKIPVTISIGVAVASREQPRSVDELIKTADMYLYKAKNTGRNRTECEVLE